MSDVDRRLAAILARGRASVTSRIESLDSVVSGLVGDTLDEPARIAAVREAHRLAGSAGSFGLPGVSELALELERLLETAGADGAARLDAALVIGKISALAAAAPELDDPSFAVGEAGGRPLQVLVVSDHSDRAGKLCVELAARGRRAVATPTGAAAWPVPGGDHPGGVIIELTGAGHHNAVALTTAWTEAVSRTGGSVPVLVVTADDDPTTHLALIDAGVSAIMPNTTPAAQIVDALDRELTETVGPAYRVIAVDDDPAVLDALRMTLEPYQITFTSVEDPTRLLAALAQDPPDLVVLDIDMPGLNGVDLCRLIRVNPQWRTLPVLFLSSRRDSATIARVFEVGADDYMTKPIIPAEVIARVRSRLERARLHRVLAETDPLTGLANRRRLEDRMAALLSLSRRLDQPLAFVVLDVDHFKRVNDVHGHAAGDAVLRHLAVHLTRSFRPDSVVARIGGEEFVIGLLGTTPELCAPRLTAVLRAFHEEGVDVNGRERLHVSVSAGVAGYPADAADFRWLYRRADEALRRAKSTGRNRVVLTREQPVGARS
ncbi:MAG TPA: diguanylate cyclase [Micromonosporaceae bacterium]|nr:diguanylate cyclase [Micromonosporaceae bacterium]